MANPGEKKEDVKVAVSMHIALAQCRNTLKRLGLKRGQASDTAGDAKELSEHPDPHKASVSPRLSA